MQKPVTKGADKQMSEPVKIENHYYYASEPYHQVDSTRIGIDDSWFKEANAKLDAILHLTEAYAGLISELSDACKQMADATQRLGANFDTLINDAIKKAESEVDNDSHTQEVKETEKVSKRESKSLHSPFRLTSGPDKVPSNLKDAFKKARNELLCEMANDATMCISTSELPSWLEDHGYSELSNGYDYLFTAMLAGFTVHRMLYKVDSTADGDSVWAITTRGIDHARKIARTSA